MPTDLEQGFIINQAMMRYLEWDSIEGKGMKCCGNDDMGSGIGLVKDFNFNSLHNEIQPLVIRATENSFSEISIKISPAAFPETIAAIEQKWDEADARLPFRYEFLDNHFEQLYILDLQYLNLD